MKSANAWLEFSQKPEFTEGLKAMVNDMESSNEERAAAVENYILQQGIAAGVVKEITITQPRNPNKWGKTLALWFTEDCRDAKKAVADDKRNYGKGDVRIVQAMRNFHKVCLKGRQAFA